MVRVCRILAAIYLIAGVGVWIQFTRTNPDGLANLGLILYVFPVTLAGLAMTKLAGRTDFLLIPGSFGYWIDHAIFFFPSLLAVAAAIAWLPPQWRRARRGAPAGRMD